MHPPRSNAKAQKANEPIYIGSDSEDDDPPLTTLENIMANPHPSSSNRHESSSRSSPYKSSASPTKRKDDAPTPETLNKSNVVDLTISSDEDGPPPSARRPQTRPSRPRPSSSRTSAMTNKPTSTPRQARPGPGPSTSAHRQAPTPSKIRPSQGQMSTPTGQAASTSIASPPPVPGTWGHSIFLGNEEDMARAREQATATPKQKAAEPVFSSSKKSGAAERSRISPSTPAGPPKGTWGNFANLQNPEEMAEAMAARAGPSRHRSGKKEQLDTAVHVDDGDLGADRADLDAPGESLPPLPPLGAWGNSRPLQDPAQEAEASRMSQTPRQTPAFRPVKVIPLSNKASHITNQEPPLRNRGDKPEPLFLPSSTPSVRGSSVRPDHTEYPSEPIPQADVSLDDTFDPAPASPTHIEGPILPQPGAWGNFIHIGPATVPTKSKRSASPVEEEHTFRKKPKQASKSRSPPNPTQANNDHQSETPRAGLSNSSIPAPAAPVIAPSPSQPARRGPTWVTESRAPIPKPAATAEPQPEPPLPPGTAVTPIIATPDVTMDVDELTVTSSSLPEEAPLLDAATELQHSPDVDITMEVEHNAIDMPEVAEGMKYLNDDEDLYDLGSNQGDVGPVTVKNAESHSEQVDLPTEKSEAVGVTPAVESSSQSTVIGPSLTTDETSTKTSEQVGAEEDVQAVDTVSATMINQEEAKPISGNDTSTDMRQSPTPSSVPSIQEVTREDFRPRAILTGSPMPDAVPPNLPGMSVRDYLRYRVEYKNRLSQTPESPTVAATPNPPPPAPTSQTPFRSEAEQPVSEAPIVVVPPAEARSVSSSEWRRIVDEDGASDVEILLDGDSGPPSDDSRLHHHVPHDRLLDPTQAPPADRRGVAKRDFNSKEIDDWNDRLPRLTVNPALHRVIFESYIQQKELESGPIGVINNIDCEGAPPAMEFEYSNEMLYNRDVPDPEKGLGCSCDGPCDPYSRSCSCARRQKLYFYDVPGLAGFAYDKNGRAKNLSIPIWECSETCGCPPQCMNRVIQRGRAPTTKLELVKTKLKGWGVQAKDKIPQGTFIGVYAGEVITEEEGEIRGELYSEIGRTYLFDLDGWQISNPPAGLKLVDPRLAEIAEATAERARGMLDDGPTEPTSSYNAYSVDAFHYGNYTRFFNHSCDPNLEITQCYVRDFHPERPLLVIFARRDIAAREELCISYKGINDDEDIPEPVIERKTGKKGKKRQSKTSVAAHVTAKDKEADAKMKRNICYCKAPNCDGRMFNL